MLVFSVDDMLCLLGSSLDLAGLLEGNQGDGGSVCHDFSHSMSFQVAKREGLLVSLWFELLTTLARFVDCLWFNV